MKNSDHCTFCTTLEYATPLSNITLKTLIDIKNLLIEKKKQKTPKHLIRDEFQCCECL